MTYAKELLNELTRQIEETYDRDEAQSIAFLLMEHFLRLKKIDILANKRLPEVPRQVNWQAILDRIRQHEPVQYLMGKTEFFGLEFIVNSAVLIPRPETEELVDWITKEYRAKEKPLHILDMGTGSGCIPICLAKMLTQATVEAWDISEAALEVARQNAAHNKVEVKFKQVDILAIATPDSGATQYDCIVSNPPYIKKSEADQMRENVLSYEPHLALFVEEETPLLFYEKIAQFCQHALQSKGYCYLEVNENHAEEVKQLFVEKGFVHAEVRDDLFGKPRFVKAGRHSSGG